MCRRMLRRPKVSDSRGSELTGADLLVRALILRRLLHRSVLAAGSEEAQVGVLLPPSAEAVLANAALRAEMRQKGLAQAARFSWQKAAGETWALYQSLL